MLMLITFVSVSATLSLAAWRVGMSRLNPISVFLGVWTLVLLCYRLPWFDLPQIPGEVWAMLWLGDAAVVAGVWLAWLALSWRDRSSARARIAHRAADWYDERQLKRFYPVAVATLAGYLVLQLARAWPALQEAGGVGAILSNGETWRRGYTALQETTAQNGFQGSSALLGAASYLLSLGSLALVWAGYYAARHRWGLASLPLVLTAVYSLFMLQRFEFVYSMLIFLFSWRLHVAALGRLPRWHGRTALRVCAAGGAAAVLLATAIVVPVHLRDRQLSAGQVAANAGLYLEAGTAGLGSAVQQNPDLRSVTGPVPGSALTEGHGSWTFTGLVSLAQRSGFDVQAPPHTYQFTKVQRSGSAEINVYTYLSYFFLDFGWLGVPVMSFLLGVAAGIAYFLALRHRSIAALPLAALLLTTLTMSFFAISLIRDFEYLFLSLCSPLLVQSVRRRPDPASPPEPYSLESRA